MTIFLAVAAFLTALVLTIWCGQLVGKTGIVDAPDGVRKKQARPVARLGGVAMAVPIAAYLAVAVLADIHPLPHTALEFGLLLLVGCCFLIGLWDDVFTAPTRAKLVLLLASGLGAAVIGLMPASFGTPFGETSSTPFLIIGSVLWFLVFINAVNFMDGSDGLAVGCLAIMFAGLMLLSAPTQNALPGPAWFTLFGALGGFLVLNLRGQLYAGDAGALGLGALFAALGIVLGIEVWTITTLTLPFLVDVLLTLVWRARHNRPWLQPHRDHAYQRLIDTGWTHIDVALTYWGLTMVCVWMGILAAKAGGAVPFIVFWALAMAGSALWISERRTHRA